MKLEIVPVDKKLAQSTRQVLDDAVTANYDTVIVFGFKDGQVQTTASDARSILNLVGALEAAKLLFVERRRIRRLIHK